MVLAMAATEAESIDLMRASVTAVFSRQAKANSSAIAQEPDLVIERNYSGR
jgi:hypothetical protein